jgi:TRL-like protein family
MKKIVIALFALAGLSTSACALLGPYGAIYADVQTSHSFFSLTKNDNSPAAEAHGEACNTNILSLIAFGNGGADAAYKAALAASGANSLWDVRVDTRIFNVLGVYGTTCTEVTGKVSR